jgi:CheY-like chemotaxis protein
MPVLDGVGAARQIKALQDAYFLCPRWTQSFLGRLAPRPAYIVGMSASIESPTEWLAAGVNEILPKPFKAFDIDQLLLSMSPHTSEEPEHMELPGRVTDSA